MKKLINNPDDVVKEALEGMQVAHADLLHIHYNPNFITRVSKTKQRFFGSCC